MTYYCRLCPRIIEEDDIDLCPDCAKKPDTQPERGGREAIQITVHPARFDGREVAIIEVADLDRLVALANGEDQHRAQGGEAATVNGIPADKAIYCCLGLWRDKMPDEAVKQLQEIAAGIEAGVGRGGA